MRTQLLLHMSKKIARSLNTLVACNTGSSRVCINVRKLRVSIVVLVVPCVLTSSKQKAIISGNPAPRNAKLFRNCFRNGLAMKNDYHKLSAKLVMETPCGPRHHPIQSNPSGRRRRRRRRKRYPEKFFSCFFFTVELLGGG